MTSRPRLRRARALGDGARHNYACDTVRARHAWLERCWLSCWRASETSTARPRLANEQRAPFGLSWNVGTEVDGSLPPTAGRHPRQATE